jgi:hypothetical protein
MTKKMMLVAASALAALAFAALPAFASASASIDNVAGHAFTGTFGTATLTNVTNEAVECTGENHVKGSFASSTTGSIHILFTNCHTHSGISCKSSGLAAGEITTEAEFHVINIEPTTAGILITPKNTTTHEFVTFSCSFLETIVVKGNGVIGDISAPACNGTSGNLTLSFTSSATGVQAYQQIETAGTVYHMESNLNGGAFSGFSEDMTSTTTLTEGSGTLTC